MWVLLSLALAVDPEPPSCPALARLPAAVQDPARRGYLSLLLGLDDAVGRLTAHLRATGRDRDTLIFFLSDNGGAGRKPFFAYNTGRNAPLRALQPISCLSSRPSSTPSPRRRRRCCMRRDGRSRVIESLCLVLL